MIDRQVQVFQGEDDLLLICHIGDTRRVSWAFSHMLPVRSSVGRRGSPPPHPKPVPCKFKRATPRRLPTCAVSRADRSSLSASSSSATGHQSRCDQKLTAMFRTNRLALLYRALGRRRSRSDRNKQATLQCHTLFTGPALTSQEVGLGQNLQDPLRCFSGSQFDIAAPEK